MISKGTTTVPLKTVQINTTGLFSGALALVENKNSIILPSFTLIRRL